MRLSEFTAAGNVLTIDVRSEIRAARFKAICRDLDQAVAALGRVRLVLVMRHYPSFNRADISSSAVLFLS